MTSIAITVIYIFYTQLKYNPNYIFCHLTFSWYRIYNSIIAYTVINYHNTSIQVICLSDLLLIDLIIYSVYTIFHYNEDIQLLVDTVGPPIVNYVHRIVN